MIKEILREQKTEFHSVENTVSTNSSSSYIDDTIVKVKLTKLSCDKENRNSINFKENYANTRHKMDIIQSKSMKTQNHSNVKSNNIVSDNEDDRFYVKNESNYEECLKKDFHVETHDKTNMQHDKILNQKKLLSQQSFRPMSAPNILEHQHYKYVTSSQTKSTSSTKNTHSGTKSCKILIYIMLYIQIKFFILFNIVIRPWRLQPEAQKSKYVGKTDPVILYQKYQQEWKQMSFPGEAKHANVRWAIREKMLGTDPHPIVRIIFISL